MPVHGVPPVDLVVLKVIFPSGAGANSLLRVEPRDDCQQGAMLLPDPPLFIRRNTLSILPIYIHQPAMHTLLAMLMDELS